MKYEKAEKRPGPRRTERLDGFAIDEHLKTAKDAYVELLAIAQRRR